MCERASDSARARGPVGASERTVTPAGTRTVATAAKRNTERLRRRRRRRRRRCSCRPVCESSGAVCRHPSSAVVTSHVSPALAHSAYEGPDLCRRCRTEHTRARPAVRKRCSERVFRFFGLFFFLRAHVSRKKFFELARFFSIFIFFYAVRRRVPPPNRVTTRSRPPPPSSSSSARIIYDVIAIN